MSPTDYARQLWRRREFTAYLAAGRIRARNASTLLGLVWWVVNPLLLAGVYYLVFGVIFQAREDLPSYFPYLISGIFVFYYTRGALLGASSMILSNAKLLINLNFPRLSLAVAGTIESAFGFLAAILVYFALTVPFGTVPGLEVLALPLVITIQTIFNLGLGALTARLAIPFRDISNIVPYLLRLWLYVSPVVYELDRVPSNLRPIIAINPMTPILELYRWSLMSSPLSLSTISAAVAWTVVTAVLGIVAFVRAEGDFVRYL